MSKRVLVVEDNELNLKLFCDLLRAHDYATEPVRDGREAVERVRAAGAEAYVSKPISLMRFIGEVVALTPKEVAPTDEAESPVPEEASDEAAASEPTFAADLFPEDAPASPTADVASAENPLPEDLPDPRDADGERPALDNSLVTPAPEPGSRYSSRAGDPVEDSERQRDPG